MWQVLRQLDYVSDSYALLLRGRVAAEMRTVADELVRMLHLCSVERLHPPPPHTLCTIVHIPPHTMHRTANIHDAPCIVQKPLMYVRARGYRCLQS